MSSSIVISTQGSPQPGPAAALAFYDLVALLQQALALTILALLLFLDVGAFFTGHESLQTTRAGMAELILRLSINPRRRSGL
jgi:hypothetical protein